ncbi:MAG: ACP phosphodiesterase [Chitinophagaceae bacterium]
MNFLAHAYLSFNSEEIVVGNLISDFVKGNKKFDYSKGIQDGISLHRKIDEFTDNHPQTKLAKQLLKPAVGLYAGAFIDVIYDYFLANSSSIFKDEMALQSFAENIYSVLEKFKAIVPPNFEKVMPSMKANNWLFNYKFEYGLQRSFEGLYRRAKFLTPSNNQAFIAFKNHKTELEEYANIFIKDVIIFSKKELATMGY